jgi:NAD(P)H-dependent FMN reductase
VESRSERIAAWCTAESIRLGADAVLLNGAQLEFPLYRHGGARPLAVSRFLSLLRSADGLVLVAPAYHGTVSGLMKNALDYVDDLREDARPFLDGRPVGCVAVASGAQGAVSTLATLRTISHALRCWPTPLGVAISGDGEFDAEGTPAGQPLVFQLGQMIGQVMTLAELNAAHRQPFAERLASA